MTELMKLEEMLVKGQMSRREFLRRVSILGLTGAVAPALWRSIAHAETPKRGAPSASACAVPALPSRSIPQLTGPG